MEAKQTVVERSGAEPTFATSAIGIMGEKATEKKSRKPSFRMRSQPMLKVGEADPKFFLSNPATVARCWR